MIQQCKDALDRKELVGIIAMDLSKASDYLPHQLLLSKLHAYGVSEGACALIKSYLCNRMQRVKIGSCRSAWSHIVQGVPQGSILGPLLFNVFTNDIFYVLDSICSLYNYADDNSLLNTGCNLRSLRCKLERSTSVALRWFEMNHMQANPDKFQAMIFQHDPDKHDIKLDISGVQIPIRRCVKLLGVHIDYQLKFDTHISSLCARTGKQIGAVSRISKYLSKECLINIYHAYILSNFSYCNIVWHFCSKENCMKMERVHKRALRVILNDYEKDYKGLLEAAHRPT